MASLTDHLAATRDGDLTARIIAAAEQAGIPGAQTWVEARRGTLVSVDLDGSTLADVLAYARAQKGLPAGADPAFITDEQIRSAVAKTREATSGGSS